MRDRAVDSISAGGHGGHSSPSLNAMAVQATLHCLTGCAIGEVLGMILSTWWGWGNLASIVLSVVLAFLPIVCANSPVKNV